MAAPKWKTPKGNLGTIQEQEYYELSLQAIVVDDSAPSLNYKIIAGALPPGLVLNETTGTINGRSKEQYRLRGVPFNVSQDVTSTFCCRVTNTKTGQIADRTFSLTVTGQDAPTIVTDAEELGQILDGAYAEFQVTAIDLDAEPLTYYITNGELPDGMTLNKDTGIISGLVQPPGFLNIDSTIGWSADGAGWDQYPWQFYARTISKRYVFDVNVTDGKDTVSRKFSIYVISKDSLTADNDIVTVNGYYDIVTADLDQKRNPVITSLDEDIGIYSHDNYFAYQFKAVDFDGDTISYSILLTSNIGFDNEIGGFDTVLFDTGNLELPPYLTLSEETGWLYGNLKQMAGIQQEYEFAIFAYKRDYPEYRSPLKNYRMTVVGDMRYYINWLTPTDLGSIVAGHPCELSIEATTTFNKSLLYSLKVGSKSRLPQGLRLLDNGLISGRPSFEITSFDDSKLTFDKTIRIGDRLLPETTFDREYTFTVRANDYEETLIAYKTFKVKVLAEYNKPYEALYLRAQPGIEDKEIYNQVVFNTDIIPNEYVYRLGDPFYGKQSNLEVLVLSGINPSLAHEYIEAMVINHYRKKLLIGEPTIARALDTNGNVKYEVLYLPMKDDNATQAKSIDLTQKIKRHITADRTSPAMDLTYFTVDGYDKVVYPNALRSMRQQIRDTLGYVDREVLPTWMTSKQEDGSIPYWTPAMILAYLKPGTGKKVKFLLNRVFEYDLKDLSFEVDRYVWDCNLSEVYNKNTDHYLTSNMTTFDTAVRIVADPIVFSFIGNGVTTSFDITSQQSDFDADVYDDATLIFDNSIISNKSVVSYTISGVDDDAQAEVIFTDSDSQTITVNDLTNGTYIVDFSTFVDGVVTATIILRDTSNNTAEGTGDTALIPAPLKLDQTITFTSTAPIDAKEGDTYIPTAIATSELPVEFSIDPTSLIEPAVCVYDSNRSMAIITYSWTAEAGVELDTMTQIVGSPDYIGWAATVEGEPYYNSSLTNDLIRYNDYDIARWLGDNGEDGPEAIIVDLSAYRAAFPESTTLTLALNANWYGARLTGDITVTVDIISGGSLNSDLTIQIAGTVIETNSYTYNVTSNVGGPTLGQALGNIEIDPIGEKAVIMLNPGLCTINANQVGSSEWNPAPQVQQSFAISTLGCTNCSIVPASAIPTYFTYSSTGVLGDAASVAEPYWGQNPIGSSCFDWIKRECHQFVWSNDNKLWCITLDADTYAEKRRCSSPDLIGFLLMEVPLPGMVQYINSIVKCPNTDWIVLSLNWFENPILTYNTVTGDIQSYWTTFYPATLDASDGYTTPSSNGKNWGSIIWAKQLGTDGTQTLVCSQIYEDITLDVIEKAGYGLFIIDNTTGAINCIAYGDFGEPKSAYWAEGESADGSCIPTEVGPDYTEFVYTAPKLWSGVDYTPEHWGNPAWLSANAVEVPLAMFETYVYKVRVTTAGVITYNLLTHLQGNTVDGPLVPDSYNATITGPIMRKSGSIECLMLYSESENSVVFVVSNYHLQFFTGDPVIRYAPVQSGSDLSLQSYRGTSLYKINLTTGNFTLTEDPNNMISPFGWNDFQHHNTAEPLLLGYPVTITPVPESEAWYGYGVMEGIGTSNGFINDIPIWKLDGITLETSEWIPNPAPLTVPASYFGVYGQNFFLDWPNCQVFIPNANSTTWPTPPYARWEIIKLGGSGVDNIADEDNDARVSITEDALITLYGFEYVVTGVDADALANVTFRDENANSSTVYGLTNGTYTFNIFDTGLTRTDIYYADIVVRDVAGNTATGIGDSATAPYPRYVTIDIINPEADDFDILVNMLDNNTNNPISNWVGQDSGTYGNTYGQDLYVGSTKVGRWAGNGTVAHEKLYIDCNALADAGLYGDARLFNFYAKLVTPAAGKYLDITINQYIGGEIDPITLEPTVEGVLYETFTASMDFKDSNLVPGFGGYIKMIAVFIPDWPYITAQFWGNNRN